MKRSASSRNWRSSVPSWKRARRRWRPTRRCATRSGSSSSARTPNARRKRRKSKRLTGTGTLATSRGTPTRRPRQRTGPAPDVDKLALALREATTTAADARCAQQHQAAVAALDGSYLGSTDPDASPPAERADGRQHAVASYLDAAEAAAADILAQAKREAQAIADRQAQAIAQLDRLLADVAITRGQLQAAQEAEGRLSAEVQAAAERVTAAELAVEERMRLLLDGYRSYLSGLAELRVADPDELIAALESWGLTGEGGNPAVAIIDDVTRVAGAELGRLAGELGSQRTRRGTRASELAEEIGRLRGGGHDVPPVPHTRVPGIRDGRPGAPLWKVTDFAPGLADDERAGAGGRA